MVLLHGGYAHSVLEQGVLSQVLRTVLLKEVRNIMAKYFVSVLTFQTVPCLLCNVIEAV